MIKAPVASTGEFTTKVLLMIRDPLTRQTPAEQIEPGGCGGKHVDELTGISDGTGEEGGTNGGDDGITVMGPSASTGGVGVGVDSGATEVSGVAVATGDATGGEMGGKVGGEIGGGATGASKTIPALEGACGVTQRLRMQT